MTLMEINLFLEFSEKGCKYFHVRVVSPEGVSAPMKCMLTVYMVNILKFCSPPCL